MPPLTGAFAAGLAAGGGGAGAAAGRVVALAGAGAAFFCAATGFCATFGAAAALRAGGAGAARFAAGAAFRGVPAFTVPAVLTGAGFRTGAAGLRGAGLPFTPGRAGAAFLTGLRGSVLEACFFAGRRATVPDDRFAGAAGVLRRTVEAGLLVPDRLGAAFRVRATDPAFPDPGRDAGFFFFSSFFRTDRTAGRPLPGAAFFGAGRGARRAGFLLVRDLAMVRAR